MADRFAVIDVETTGLGRLDRLVEVAVVTLDVQTGSTLDEYDSLVNPLRDIGPAHVHGVTSSMVSTAPTFEEVAAALAVRIDGAVLVAHNLSFDTRMLIQEYERLGASLVAGEGICTLRLSGQRLNLACTDYGISIGQHHRALADARATAELLRRLIQDPDIDHPAELTGLSVPLNPRTLRREATNSGMDAGPLDRIVARARYPSADLAVIAYLDVLDWVLDDLAITSAEQAELDACAEEFGLTGQDITRAHKQYLDNLVVAAQRDGVITSEEHALLTTVADLLNLDTPSGLSRSPQSTAPSLVPGLAVCFTGSAVVDGAPVQRADLERLAESAGLRPVPSITKKTELLVAADPSSMSGKAKKARQYGIAIMSIEEFIKQCKHLP